MAMIELAVVAPALTDHAPFFELLAAPFDARWAHVTVVYLYS